MVVHFQDAHTANAAVMRPIRFHNLTLFAVAYGSVWSSATTKKQSFRMYRNKLNFEMVKCNFMNLTYCLSVGLGQTIPALVCALRHFRRGPTFELRCVEGDTANEI